MKSGLLVVAACMVVGAVLGVGVYLRIREGLAQTQDVVTGLIYFMEQHDGRFPSSEAEFLGSEFVERLPGGAIRIKGPRETKFRNVTNGASIPSLPPFEIRWGTDLSTLQLNEYGKAKDPEGNTVELLKWQSSPPAGKGYTIILLDAFRHCRPVPRALPATMPAIP